MATFLRRVVLNLVAANRMALACFPRRLLCSGSLVEVKPGDIGIISGIPEEQLRRRVLACSISHTARIRESWQMENIFTVHTKETHMQMWATALSFDRAEDAKAFAEKHGWQYVVKKHHTPLLKPKAYADNFKLRVQQKSKEIHSAFFNLML